jgi:NAD(P)-dependent dehydrogenase (short-subunit alcohol dehydrogenase family)
MYQKNVLSAARLIQGLVPAMKAKGWGRIVQLGTIGSHQPNSIMPHYYAAKGALATMSVSLTKELSHTGITVNTISPGYIRTAELEAGFRRRAEKKGWGENWDDIVKQIVASEYPNPCGRIAERQEVADLVAFICSERAGFINGQNIRIDGGAVCYV